MLLSCLRQQVRPSTVRILTQNLAEVQQDGEYWSKRIKLSTQFDPYFQSQWRIKMNFTITKKLITGFTLLSMHLVSIASIAAQSSKVDYKPEPIAKVSTDGSSCSIDAGTGQNLADKLAVLGQDIKNKSLLPVRKSTLKGLPVEYVSSGTGELSFAVNDISYSGASSLLFQRYFSSNNKEDIGLGKGWSFIYNDRISVDFDQATLTNSLGEKFEYVGKNYMLDEKTVTMKFTLENPEPALIQSFQFESRNVIVEKTASYKKTYRKFGKDFYLSNIKLSTGDNIGIKRFQDGRIAKVVNKSNYIRFNWSEAGKSRLLSVSDHANRRVQFAQNRGVLQKVKTASGRNWRYAYDNEKLVKVLNPANNVELKVQYDGNNRVALTSNEVNFRRYKYEKSGDVKVTTVITSENYSQSFKHNSKGLVDHIYDEKSTIAKLEYDGSNRLVSMTDDRKTLASFEYNDEGKMLRQQMPNQTTRSFEYDSEGKITAINENGVKTSLSYDSNGVVRERKSLGNGNDVNAKFNRLGRVSFVKASGRNIKYEYDLRGNEKAKTVSDEGRYETKYDAIGRKVIERFPGGKVIRSQYNSAGKVIRMRDNSGKEVRAEYNASNLMTRVFNKNGWIKTQRDKAGRIIQLKNSDGQSREFRYNSNGSLIQFKNAKGATYNFFYTPRGKMKAVANSKGRAIEYRLDEDGKAMSAKRYWLNNKTDVTFGKINYRKTTIQNNTIFDCRDFGFNDGFDGFGPLTSSPTTYFPDGSCSDPFSSFGGGLGAGSVISGGFFFGGETCNQCLDRENKNCLLTALSCAAKASGALAGATILCSLVGPGYAVCVAAATAIYVGVIASCAIDEVRCLNNVANKCSSKCRLL